MCQNRQFVVNSVNDFSSRISIRKALPHKFDALGFYEGEREAPGSCLVSGRRERLLLCAAEPKNQRAEIFRGEGCVGRQFDARLIVTVLFLLWGVSGRLEVRSKGRMVSISC